MVLTKNLPLANRRIVVTRARSQASELAAILESYGARVLCCPTIRIVPPETFEPLDRTIKNLGSYDWLIFTSANGVEKFMLRFKNIFQKVKFPPHLKTCAIGPGTAKKMKTFGIPLTRVSKDYIAESILEEIDRPRGKKILIPRASNAREILPKELLKRGAQVDVVTAYQVVVDHSNFSTFRQWLKTTQVHCITFTSSSTVTNFFSLLKRSEKTQIIKNKNIHSASIGPITTKRLKEYGWNPSIIALKPTIHHLATAITDFYSGKREI